MKAKTPTYATDSEELPVADVFGVDAPKSVKCRVQKTNHPNVPEVDPEYHFNKDHLRVILRWLQPRAGDRLQNEGLYLTGPTGAGKSSIIEQVCARLGIPVQSVIGHERMETPELIGRPTLIGGDTLWIDGPMTTSAREGHVFLLDEIDVVHPATASGFNTVLDRRPLSIPENNEVVEIDDNFRFAATANTNGGGDLTGLYQGTLQQNAALMDRFIMLECDYLPHQTEKAILLKKVPGLGSDLAGKLVKVANEVRKLHQADDPDAENVEVTFSTRTLIRWASLAQTFKQPLGGEKALEVSLDQSLGNRAMPESREAIQGVRKRILGG